MKKLFLFLLLSTSVDTFCQTTIEEYNYCTKGYKVQLESGLDQKKGYTVHPLKTIEYDGLAVHNFKLFQLTKQSDNKNVAALIVKHNVKTFEYWYCIPNPNSDNEILQKSYEDIQTVARSKWSELDFYKALTKLFFYLSLKSYF